MLKVGTDSYVTLTEADDFVRLASDNINLREEWFNLNDEAKERKLRNACYRIDSLRLGSHKHSIYQNLQFPRGTTDVVPTRVKQAQVLEAIATLDTQAARRRELQVQGVKSVSIGNASETYADTGNGSSAGNTQTLVSSAAYALLKPYLLGSAVMR